MSKKATLNMKLFHRISLVAVAALALALPARADLIKQGATYNRTVLMTDSADHISGKTGLTLTVTASKNGGAFASITPTVTERGNGRYNIALTVGNTDTLGALDLQITATGADPTDTHDQVVAFDPSDAAGLGLSRLDTTVGSRLATGGVVGSVTGAVGSVTSAVTVGTNNDKTGYALTVAPPTLAQITALFPSNFSTLLVGTGGDAGKVTTSNPASSSSGPTAADFWNYSLSGVAASTYFPAIKTKTDNLTFVSGGVVASLSSDATTALSSALGSSVLKTGITRDQAALLAAASVAGSYTIGTLDTSAHTQVYTYYVPGTTETAMANGTGVVVGTSTLVYNSANTTVLRRKYVPAP